RLTAFERIADALAPFLIAIRPLQRAQVRPEQCRDGITAHPGECLVRIDDRTIRRSGIANDDALRSIVDDSAPGFGRQRAHARPAVRSRGGGSDTCARSSRVLCQASEAYSSEGEVESRPRIRTRRSCEAGDGSVCRPSSTEMAPGLSL